MAFSAMFRERLAQMKPSDRRAMVLLGVFLLSVGGYVFLLEPLILGFQAAQAELADLSRQHAADLQKVRMLPRREAKLYEYTAELESVKLRFEIEPLAPEAAVSNMISELSRYADLCRVQIGGIRPLDAENVGRFVETPVEIEAEGAFADLHKFFYFIETSDSLLAITELELRPQVDGRLIARLKVSNIAERAREAPTALQSVAVPRESRLRIALPRWLGYAPLIVAESNGYLQGPDFQIDLIRVDDQAAVERLLATGVADLGGASLVEWQALRVKGLDLSLLLPLASSQGTEGILVAAESPIQTIDDLRSRELAVDTQGVRHFVLFEILAGQGLSLSDVRAEDRPPRMVAREIASGTLEAGLVREPQMSVLLESGQARLLASSERLQGLLVDFLVVAAGAGERKEDALGVLVRALVQARQFMTENPEQTARIVAAWLGQPERLVQATLPRIEFFAPEQAGAFASSADMERLVARAEAYFRATGRPWPMLPGSENQGRPGFELVDRLLGEAGEHGSH